MSNSIVIDAPRSSPPPVGEKKECGFNDIPKDIALEIFSYLKPKTIGFCAQVCKSWQKLSYCAFQRYVFNQEHKIKALEDKIAVQAAAVPAPVAAPAGAAAPAPGLPKEAKIAIYVLVVALVAALGAIAVLVIPYIIAAIFVIVTLATIALFVTMPLWN